MSIDRSPLIDCELSFPSQVSKVLTKTRHFYPFQLLLYHCIFGIGKVVTKLLHSHGRRCGFKCQVSYFFKCALWILTHGTRSLARSETATVDRCYTNRRV